MPYRTELKRPDLKGQFPCSVCGKVFCHSSSLSRHRMQAHFKSYTCSQCNQEITTNETLRTHMYKYHHISRMFMCRCCNWAFPDKTSLHIHMQSMTRTGHPGDVSVLARSSIEGESLHALQLGDMDVKHSPSTSPHDEDGGSVSPSTIGDDLQKTAARHSASKSTKTASANLFNNADILNVLSTFFANGQNGLTSKISSMLGNNISNANAPTIFPSHQQQQQQSPLIPNSSSANLDQQTLDLLKKLKTGDKNPNPKDFLSVLSQINTNSPAAPTSGIFSPNSNNGLRPQSNADMQSRNLQQQIFGFLKNNPSLMTENGAPNSKLAVMNALTAMRNQVSSGSSTSSSASINQAQQHLPHTPTGASSLMSDISRLLSMSTAGNHSAVPPAKRSRVSSTHSAGYQQANSNSDIASAAISVLQQQQQQQRHHLKSEPSVLDDLNLSISTSMVGMHAADLSAINTAAASHLSAGGESSSAGALSSTSSSPRAGTPSGKLISLIDKMHYKREGGSVECDGRASSAQESCVTPNSERRLNRRKARPTKHFTDAKPDFTDGATHSPATKTSMFESLAQLAQQSANGKAATQGQSQQPSPAVSDSQTSGSSATTQILDLIATNGVISKAKDTTTAPSKSEAERLKSHIEDLEPKLRSSKESQHDLLETRLNSIFAVADNALHTASNNAESDKKSIILQCLKNIRMLANIHNADLKVADQIEEPSKIIGSIAPSLTVGLDMEEEDDSMNATAAPKVTEINDSVMDEEEDEDTIEIQCAPSPTNEEPATPSPRPDIMPTTEQELQAISAD